ncbi:unnamed protein product, partial [Urochloa humidicola]
AHRPQNEGRRRLHTARLAGFPPIFRPYPRRRRSLGPAQPQGARYAMAFQGKKLINNPDDVVTEFIEGLVETYPGLQYLDGFPQ